jgi:hypothetical protein
MSDVGTIGELIALQKAYNEWRENATPDERQAANLAQLRYIGTVEPEMAWVLEALDEPA